MLAGELGKASWRKHEEMISQAREWLEQRQRGETWHEEG